MDNLCIGTAQFGMDYGIANKTGMPNIEMIKQIVKIAKTNNIFYYDTAQSYGCSEEILGESFSQLNISERVKCITKLHPDYSFINYCDLESIVFESISRLKISQLWGLLIHRPLIKGSWNNFINGVHTLKQKGIIKNFGVSLYNPKDALRFAYDNDINIIQIPFNILDKRLIENNFFNIAKEHDKLVFIRSVYLQGLILMDETAIIKKNMEWAIPYLKLIRTFIEQRKIDIKTFAIKAITDFIPSLNFIFGVESVKQLEENINIFRKGTVTTEIVAEWWKKLPSLPEKLLNPSLW